MGDHSDELTNKNLSPDTFYVFDLKDEGSLIDRDICRTEAEEEPKPEDPKGSISCDTVDENTIDFSYEAYNFNDGEIYRDSDLIVKDIVGNYSDHLTNRNLSPGTFYTFKLKDEGSLVDKDICRTEREPVVSEDPYGDLECGKRTTDSIEILYEGEEVSNASLFRGNTRLRVLGSGEIHGSYLDTGLSENTRYTYYLRDGRRTSSERLARVSCRTLREEDKEIDVSKRVKLANNDSGFSSSLETVPGKDLVYSIRVTATEDRIRNITVKDDLPEKIRYKGNLKLDGDPISGDMEDGVEIRRISGGETKELTYEARIADEDKFLYATTSLTNVAKAYTEDLHASDSATVDVTRERDEVPTEIPTGITGNSFFDYFLIPLSLTLLVFFLFRKQIMAFIRRMEDAREEMIEGSF